MPSDPIAWWPLHHYDFWGSEFVTTCSPGAAALYIWLLGEQWHRGSLAADPETLRNLAPLALREAWPALWPEVESRFPLDNDGRRRNERMREMRDRRFDEQSRRSDAGRVGRAKQLGREPGPKKTEPLPPGLDALVEEARKLGAGEPTLGNRVRDLRASAPEVPNPLIWALIAREARTASSRPGIRNPAAVYLAALVPEAVTTACELVQRDAIQRELARAWLKSAKPDCPVCQGKNALRAEGAVNGYPIATILDAKTLTWFSIRPCECTGIHEPQIPPRTVRN